uniref:Uncharacterized protein n=1 Tax=Spermophilus dauricus TaxID=99837 RepID=A0A8C9Q686_SPEDA
KKEDPMASSSSANHTVSKRGLWGMDGCQLNKYSCPHLSEVLLSNANLRHLDLSRNPLMDEGVAQLCEALRQPACRLQTLCLQQCEITPRGCQDLAFVLASNPNLRSLDVGGNNIGDAGVRLLSKALLHPHCGLKELSLESCQLTRACCEDLASVIAHSQTLHELDSLDLATNVLGDSAVTVLCEGLWYTDPGLFLGHLLWQAGGVQTDHSSLEVLSSALSCNPHLTSLDLLCRDFDPQGPWLCSALARPTCSLGEELGESLEGVLGTGLRLWQAD